MSDHPEPSLPWLPHEVERVQRRTVAVLSQAQILGGIAISSNVAAGGLIAAQIAGTESVAGLATTSTVTGAALAAIPLASLTMDRGRRFGLATGLAIGSVGAAIVVVGAWREWLPLLLVGTLLLGAASASNLQSRFAATDLAQPERAARSLSIVVWATTIGAVLGPNLTGPGSRLGSALGLPALAGTYVITAACLVGGAALIWWRLRPDPLLLARRHEARPTGAGPRPGLAARTARAWATVRAHPGALLGLAAVTLAHAVMVSVMVMTPVHMAHAHVSISVIGLVISIHVLGMFAFAPLMGWASDRFGRATVVLIGSLLLLASTSTLALTSASHSSAMAGGLFVLGLGWSANHVAGSTLVSESVPSQERQSVQGLSDLAMNTGGAIAGAVSGIVVATLSYGWLALVAGLVILPIVVASASVRARLGSARLASTRE